jgi:hypothetical protein
MQESTQWQTKDNRKGVFDDYTVMGFKFQNPDGEMGWHISASRTGINPIHDYWVAGKDFYSVTIHYFYKGTPINLIEIYRPHINEHVDADERKAVLKAIAEWMLPSSDEISQRTF